MLLSILRIICLVLMTSDGYSRIDIDNHSATVERFDIRVEEGDKFIANEIKTGAEESEISFSFEEKEEGKATPKVIENLLESLEKFIDTRFVSLVAETNKGHRKRMNSFMLGCLPTFSLYTSFIHYTLQADPKYNKKPFVSSKEEYFFSSPYFEAAKRYQKSLNKVFKFLEAERLLGKEYPNILENNTSGILWIGREAKEIKDIRIDDAFNRFLSKQSLYLEKDLEWKEWKEIITKSVVSSLFLLSENRSSFFLEFIDKYKETICNSSSKFRLFWQKKIIEGESIYFVIPDFCHYFFNYDRNYNLSNGLLIPLMFLPNGEGRLLTFDGLLIEKRTGFFISLKTTFTSPKNIKGVKRIFLFFRIIFYDGKKSHASREYNSTRQYKMENNNFFSLFSWTEVNSGKKSFLEESLLNEKNENILNRLILNDNDGYENDLEKVTFLDLHPNDKPIYNKPFFCFLSMTKIIEGLLGEYCYQKLETEDIQSVLFRYLYVFIWFKKKVVNKEESLINLSDKPIDSLTAVPSFSSSSFNSLNDEKENLSKEEEDKRKLLRIALETLNRPPQLLSEEKEEEEIDYNIKWNRYKNNLETIVNRKTKEINWGDVTFLLNFLANYDSTFISKNFHPASGGSHWFWSRPIKDKDGTTCLSIPRPHGKQKGNELPPNDKKKLLSICLEVMKEKEDEFNN